MVFVSDIRRIVTVSYSFWSQVLGLVALIVPELLFGFWGVEIDPYVLWWVGIGLLLFGLAGRLVEQTGSVAINALRIVAVTVLVVLLSFVAASAMGAQPAPVSEPPGRAATEAQTLAIAVPFIGEKEGVRLNAYLDIVGVPTICYGSTRGVVLGMSMTKDQCDALLRAEVSEYRRGLHQYFEPITVQARLPPARDAAYTSLAFNVGIGAAGNSTAVKRLNRGDIVGGCDAITWWNRAGGRVVRGLVLRRAEERDLCLQGAG